MAYERQVTQEHRFTFPSSSSRRAYGAPQCRRSLTPLRPRETLEIDPVLGGLLEAAGLCSRRCRNRLFPRPPIKPCVIARREAAAYCYSDIALRSALGLNRTDSAIT